MLCLFNAASIQTQPHALSTWTPHSLYSSQSSTKMSRTALLASGCCYSCSSTPRSFNQRPRKEHSTSFNVPCRSFSTSARKISAFLLFRQATIRTRSFQQDHGENYETVKPKYSLDEQNRVVDDTIGGQNSEVSDIRGSFLAKLAVALGIAAAITVISFGLKGTNLGSLLGVQRLTEGSSSSIVASSPGFTFNAFGYRFVLPEYAPGWIYFWLLMAAGCGLFISEEALNIWVGISLARMLSLDGTWHSLVESLSRNVPHIISTVLWVYWGVCISDMVPFYLGKWFRRTGALDDVYSKLGIGKEKALSITHAVQKYGNLIGFVERFSLGVRNPTAFIAGAMGISPEYFFAGVCCGGLITLPIQLGIGFLLRKRPVFALATVATAVGIWTVFPYLAAALTALVLFLRRHKST